MTRRLCSRLPFALLAMTLASPLRAEFILDVPTPTREVPVSGAAERHVPVDEARTQWGRADDDAAQGDKVELQKVLAKDVKTVKLQNVVPPIQFASGEAEIPADYIARLRQVLERMKDRTNVRLHFVGHTDDVPLRGALLAQYGDNLALSRERAGTTAEYFQQALNLPPESISYEGMGETQPVASNATAAGKARNRRVEVEVWYDEIGQKLVEKEVVIAEQFNRVKVCRVETVCKLRYKDGHGKRARIRNLVPPLHFDDETTRIPPAFIGQLSQALTNLRDKQNVTVKFVGHTDNLPLGGRVERIYGTHLGLSKARARRAALAVQDALRLPTAAIDVDGKGAALPIAGNDTDKGRAVNRRIEVEFWYDDPLQELPDEPQICPEAAGAETVTRVHEPSTGPLGPILFEQGQPVMPAGYAERLKAVMDEVAGKTHVRLRFVGYTDNARLDRRTAVLYGDDIGLSAARARRAMTAVQTQLALTDKQVESEGRGYVQSADVVNTGFIESDTARVEVQVVYDELAALDDDHLEITRLTREVTPKDPFALNLMRITVDGKPIDDPNKGLADVQRCTDVALDQAHMRFEFDNLGLKPRLNVSAWPTTIRYQDDAATDFADNLVRFRLHTNYAAAIAKAEVRVFDAGQWVRATPRAVIALGADGRGEWQPALDAPAAPGRELQYVLRVYDRDGRFDETAPQALWVVDALADDIAAHDVERELLVGYGETRLAVQNIPQRGGTIKIFGRGIPAGHGVWLAGRAVPVDGDGAFVAEEILPAGLHTVEVAVLDAVGNGELFLRDLELKKSDWFHVGIADVTASLNATNGPAQLVTQAEHARYDEDLSVDGRLAFYTTGKFGDGWQLTASADTLEGRIEEIFDNFLDKSPNALFRRLDPDYHYPTFGDDSTVEEDAPTLGKFYAKLKKDKSHAMWGNFKIGYADTTLAHVDRGLYGANVHYQSPATTGFGEPRLLVDAFGAEPGTLAGRDEFLGTGGSLYFLRHQDILVGSERVRIEVRDKDSGIVVAVKNLTPALDYDIDYLQGRLTLSAPLSATTADEMLVQSDGLSGNDAFLVVRYEFTPGFDDVDTVSTGGRAHVWFNDHVKFGVTSNNNDDDSADSSLQAADLTLRKNAQTWIKVEASETEGAFNETLVSGDGGFTFGQLLAPNVRAAGQRIDASLGFADVIDGARGQATVYTQSLEAGYSAPGLITDKDTEQFGGTLQTPLTDKLALKAKADTIDRDRGLSTRAGEVDLAYALDERWTLSSGVRHDQREDNSAVVPLTQVEGERTDLAARATYDSKGRWLAYGYVQETLAKTDTREDNGRVGSGGSYRVSDRFKLTGEASTGDLGEAVRLGTEYLYSDRTNLYLNYALENETSDNGVRAKKGSLISGAKTRYSDSASIYVEEKYSHGDVPTGLMHSTGVNLAPADRWTVGANLDVGTLRDPITAASMDRQAAGVTVGYGAQAVKWASALEYRVDETQNATDLSVTERETWLTKNSVKYQINPDWRFIGKLNHSESRSSQGEFYDGSYTEAVAGYAFRPVAHDRLNTLLKYTYFYNLPTAGQVTPTNATAEFIQKSHIFSLDTLYDLTTQWTVGFKYAYRLGQLAMDRVDPEFFDSRAHLYVVRADWHFRRHWDALVEARRLTLPDAQDQRDGALVALYRHVNDNVKLGAGYNFTDFSDDLTDLDYDHQGVFINVVGKW